MSDDVFTSFPRFGPLLILGGVSLILTLQTRRTSAAIGRSALSFGRTGRQRWARGLFTGSIAVAFAATATHAFGPPLEPLWLSHGLGLRLEWIGLIVAFVGVVTVLVAREHMGLRWRIGIPEEGPDQLVTTGLFRVSRNPVFLGMIMVAIGLAISLPSVLMAACAVAFIVGCEIQIRDEETLLEEAFGDDYWAYRQRVRRWI